jgi:transposase
MITLDSKAKDDLRKLRKQTRDKKQYVKLSVILMLSSGYSSSQVEECLGIDGSTVYRYAKLYGSVSLSEYLKDHHVEYSGKLSEEQSLQVVKQVRDHVYLTAKEVAVYIKATFGIAYSVKGAVKLLHRLGFSYKKPKQVPPQANAAAQEKFLDTFNSMLENQPDTVVYFNDGVHPQHNTKADYGWILRGYDCLLPSNTGRHRVNITGALNARDTTDVLAVDAESVNAQSTLTVWEAAEKRHPGRRIIHICDNAKYYHSKVLSDWLNKHPDTSVMYLPAYSPNLNLIERLWRFMRKKVINSVFYETKEKFRRGILDFFANISHYKEELDTLLTLKFRVNTLV